MNASTLLKCLLLVHIFSGTTEASTPNCCQNSEIRWIQYGNCTDGSRVRLQCSQGLYVFQPSLETEEKFRLIESAESNESWLSIENIRSNSISNITADNYCMTKMADEKEDEDQKDENVFLICFSEQLDDHQVWTEICFGIFSVLSSFFLAVTLLVYLILPEMRDIQDKAMMSMTASFMVAFFLLGNQYLQFPLFEDSVTCLFIAFIMYYAYLCAFFWMNIISFNIFRSVWLPSWKISSNVLFIIYSTIGWGSPFCFLVATFTTHHIKGFHLKPGFGEVNCWFNGSGAKWAFFYGPILALLTINLCYLALTSYKLWHSYRDLDCCKLKVLRFKCSMFAKLAIITGFTWIFEVLSFPSTDDENTRSETQFYWIVPDLLNVLQGVFVFILLVISRKRVRKLLAKRRPCNIPFPKSWTAYEDLESCAVPIGIEELELSETS